MTVIQTEYAALREGGLGHRSAIARIADRHGLAYDDVLHSLRRADAEDAREARRAAASGGQ